MFVHSIIANSIEIVADVSTSKFINVDKDSGDVLNSFQFTNKQTGFNLKIFKVYDFLPDEFLITADGTYNNNMIGYSENSRSDAMLFKLNLTSQSIVQSSVWDCQNGVELATSVEYDSDYIYSLGQKDNTYLFIKKHNKINFSNWKLNIKKKKYEKYSIQFN